MEKRLQEIATRKAELKAMLEGETQVDLDAIKKELDELDVEEKSINEKVEEETRKAEAEAEKRRKEAEELAKNEKKGKEIVEKKEGKKMLEVRNTPEYIEAYARYIKTGDDAEVRALLTENVNGTIAVPDFVYDQVKTAWDNEQVMALVRKVNLKGNLKVNFEISSTGAVKHLEGSEAVAEETLVEGIATLIPTSIKKWISISDEVYDMRGEAFLQYIYAELAHHIAKKCADELVGMIADLPQEATSTTPNADKVAIAPSQSAIATGIAHLSDEATNPVIIMNKLSYANFKAVQYAGNYGVDVFENLKVVFNNTLPAYDTADADDVYAIVGDLDLGALANYPNGVGNIEFKFDTMSKKKEDMIEILGREFVGLGIVAPKAFTLLSKPSASI